MLPDFLTDIFCGSLGYSGPVETPDSSTLSRENHIEMVGEFASAVLGRFQKDKEQFVGSTFICMRLPGFRWTNGRVRTG